MRSVEVERKRAKLFCVKFASRYIHAVRAERSDRGTHTCREEARKGREEKRREEKRRRKMEERAIMRAPSIRNYADVAPHRNR